MAERIPGPLGLGGGVLGNLYARLEDTVAEATVQAAWDAGVRLFDTAPHYGAGLAELRMGAVLRRQPRDAYWIATKVGRRLVAAADVPERAEGFVGGLPFRRVFDYSAEGAHRSLEDSLARMGISRVDIAYVHDVSKDIHGADWARRFDEAMRGAAPALAAMRDAGEIRAWGFGLNQVEACLAALERVRPDVFLVAGRYTLLDQTALAGLFPACQARGVKVVVGGPYNSGLLAGGETFDYVAASPEVAARARALAEACARHGVALKAAALQFCAAHPVVVAVIPGARTPEEARENAALMAAPVPAALWAELRGAGLLPEEAPVPAE